MVRAAPGLRARVVAAARVRVGDEREFSDCTNPGEQLVDVLRGGAVDPDRRDAVESRDRLDGVLDALAVVGALAAAARERHPAVEALDERGDVRGLVGARLRLDRQ